MEFNSVNGRAKETPMTFLDQKALQVDCPSLIFPAISLGSSLSHSWPVKRQIFYRMSLAFRVNDASRPLGSQTEATKLGIDL